jgi:hypothetical protein
MRKLYLLFAISLFTLGVRVDIFAQPDFIGSQLSGKLFRGVILPHSQDINHLITKHPVGFVLEYDFCIKPNKEWYQAYNYPVVGFSVIGQDYGNEILGQTAGALAHVKFFFLKRNIQLQLAQGLGFTTNPFDVETNSKNNVFGSTVLGATIINISHKNIALNNHFSFNSGFTFIHFSNGRTKSPNKGLNSFVYAFGLTYHFNKTIFEKLKVEPSDVNKGATQNIKINANLMGGLNESIYINQGQKPFFHGSIYADKKVSRYSAWQMGFDGFLSYAYQQQIRFRGTSFPEEKPVDPNTDFRRVGFIIGHELFITKLSFITQAGAYVYKPFMEDGRRFYQRIGFKYYLSNKFFISTTLKTHFAGAEAVEYGIGIRW